MVDFLADDTILLVFLVVGLGAGLGAVRVKGVALGPAAALFVGLAIGAVDESLSGADGLGFLRTLGLVLFTYTVGLASGPLLGRRLPLPAKLEPPAPPPRTERIINWTVRVTSASQPSLAELRARYPGIGFSRIEHDAAVSVATEEQRLAVGDRVVVLGPESVVAACCRDLGE